MNTNEIKKLIEQFYNGETTTGEEQILKDYFNSENVADELLDEKELFLSMHKNDAVEVPPMLENKLSNLIDELEKKENKSDIQPQRNRHTLWLQIGSIAAGVALLVTAGLYLSERPVLSGQANQTGTETVIETEEEHKIREAQEALILLSSKFNKGVGQLAVVSEGLDKTQEILNKSFN